MEFLKNVLGDKYDEFKGIIDKYNSENKDKAIKLADLSSGEYVSKAKFDALEGEKKNAGEQLETANSTIETLKKNNKDNEELQNKISGYETTISSLKTEAANLKKTYALKEQLSKEGVTDPDYIIYKQGGIDKFTFNDEGKPVGVSDIVKLYKKDTSMSHLFQQTHQNYNPAGGDGKETVNPFAKETFNLTKQGKLFKENPEHAKELAMAAGIEINF